jgi:hypothetical protein
MRAVSFSLSVVCSLCLALVAGCATTERHALVPSAPSFSTPDSSFQTSYVGRGSSYVSRVQVNADLVVRPDSVCVPIQVTASANDDATAMALVQEATRALAVGGASLRIDDIDAHSDRTDEGARSTVTLRGVVETDLPEGDAWERARKVGALHRALAEKVTLRKPAKLKDDEPWAHIGIGNAEPGVKDLEKHRPQLLASWSERARALAAAATAEGQGLELTGCVPPAQVQIVGGTLEKVGLALPVTCTFRVPPR